MMTLSEALAVVFGFREWSSVWLGRRVRREIARQLTLNLSDGCIRPHVVAHVPGLQFGLLTP